MLRLTLGSHVKRVLKNKFYSLIEENTKQENTKNLKENTSKVYNSRNNTKRLKKENILQVFYPKRKREVGYNNDKERRYIGNPYPEIEERRKSNEYIPHPHFNNKIFFTYNEHNKKIIWAKVLNI